MDERQVHAAAPKIAGCMSVKVRGRGAHREEVLGAGGRTGGCGKERRRGAQALKCSFAVAHRARRACSPRCTRTWRGPRRTANTWSMSSTGAATFPARGPPQPDHSSCSTPDLLHPHPPLTPAWPTGRYNSLERSLIFTKAKVGKPGIRDVLDLTSAVDEALSGEWAYRPLWPTKFSVRFSECPMTCNAEQFGRELCALYKRWVPPHLPHPPRDAAWEPFPRGASHPPPPPAVPPPRWGAATPARRTATPAQTTTRGWTWRAW